jgi:hypothetical protein
VEFQTVKHVKKNFLSNPARLVIAAIVILAIAAVIGSCGKKPVPPPQILFEIESDDDTNGGRSFYIAIRSVNHSQFLADSYQDVANMIFTNPADSSVLATQVILPGEDKEIIVVKPDKDVIGFYCFFTDPGDPWKIMLDQPLGEEYEIVLKKNRIAQSEKTLEKKKGFFRRLWPF